MIALLFLQFIIYLGGKNGKEEVEDQIWGLLEHPWICWIHLLLHCQRICYPKPSVIRSVQKTNVQEADWYLFKSLCLKSNRYKTWNNIIKCICWALTRLIRLFNILLTTRQSKTASGLLLIKQLSSLCLQLIGSHRYCSVCLLRLWK